MFGYAEFDLIVKLAIPILLLKLIKRLFFPSKKLFL